MSNPDSSGWKPPMEVPPAADGSRAGHQVFVYVFAASLDDVLCTCTNHDGLLVACAKPRFDGLVLQL